MLLGEIARRRRDNRPLGDDQLAAGLNRQPHVFLTDERQHGLVGVAAAGAALCRAVLASLKPRDPRKSSIRFVSASAPIPAGAGARAGAAGNRFAAAAAAGCPASTDAGAVGDSKRLATDRTS